MARPLASGLFIGALALLAGSATPVAYAQDCDGWVALHELLPRRNPVMLKTGSDTAFLFGGSLSGNGSSTELDTATSETWQFDGARWRFITMSGPSPRAGMAGAFDSTRNRTYLFGGQRLNPLNGTFLIAADTWEFADGGWTQRTPAHAPSARYGHAMVYDPSRSKAFLYGGSNVSSGLFWEFDGEDWTEIPLTSPNPGPIGNAKLVLDPRDNSIVLISTSSAWRWNGTQWSQLASPGIQPYSAFFDADLNTFILVSNTGFFYSYSGTTPAQQILALPAGAPTSFAASVVPTSHGWLTIAFPNNSFAQTTTQFLVSPANGWQPLAVRTQPRAAEEMAFGYHNPTGEFVLFGGVPSFGMPAIAETWTLRGETWRQYTGTQPTPRSNAYLAYSPQRNASILLGGNVGGATLWSWTGSAWTSTPTGNVQATPGTPPVFDASRNAIVWPIGGSVVIVDSSTATFTAPGRTTTEGASAFDPVRGMVFSSGPSTPFLSRLNGSAPSFAWQSVSLSSGPVPAWAPRMVYEPQRGGLVLFGGFNGASGDTTAFPRRTYFLASEANAWTTLPFAFNGPIGRKHEGLAYDPIAKRIVMYGGLTHGGTVPLRETWKLARGPAAVELEPADRYVVPGQTAEVFIIASGGGVIDYQWFKDGTPLANSSRITGADSDTLQIQNFTSVDDGEYHVTVHNPCGDDQSITVQVRAIPACPGDFDNSGGVDATDIAAFFSAYERGLLLADVDLSGGIDANDMAVFFASFEAGGC